MPSTLEVCTDIGCSDCGYDLSGQQWSEGSLKCPECGVRHNLVWESFRAPPSLLVLWAWLCGPTFLICGLLLAWHTQFPKSDQYGMTSHDVELIALLTSPLPPFIAGFLLSVRHYPRAKQFKAAWRLGCWGSFVNILILLATAIVYPPGPFAIAC